MIYIDEIVLDIAHQQLEEISVLKPHISPIAEHHISQKAEDELLLEEMLKEDNVPYVETEAALPEFFEVVQMLEAVDAETKTEIVNPTEKFSKGESTSIIDQVGPSSN